MSQKNGKKGNGAKTTPAADAAQAATAAPAAETATATAEAQPAPAVPHINGEFPAGAKIETSLASPLEVFGKKDVAGKAANMKPCAAIIFEKLAQVAANGEHIIRVKKPNSTRIFYTTEGKLSNGEGAPAANLILPAPAPAPAAEEAKAAEAAEAATTEANTAAE